MSGVSPDHPLKKLLQPVMSQHTALRKKVSKRQDKSMTPAEEEDLLSLHAQAVSIRRQYNDDLLKETAATQRRIDDQMEVAEQLHFEGSKDLADALRDSERAHQRLIRAATKQDEGYLRTREAAAEAQDTTESVAFALQAAD